MEFVRAEVVRLEAKSLFLPANPRGQVDVVAIVRSYLEARGGEVGNVLFSNFTRAKGGGVMFLNTPLNRGNAVTLLREGLYQSGFLADFVTLHSLKPGRSQRPRIMAALRTYFADLLGGQLKT